MIFTGTISMVRPVNIVPQSQVEFLEHRIKKRFGSL